LRKENAALRAELAAKDAVLQQQSEVITTLTNTIDDGIKAVSGAKDLIAAKDVEIANLTKRFNAELSDDVKHLQERLAEESIKNGAKDAEIARLTELADIRLRELVKDKCAFCKHWTRKKECATAFYFCVQDENNKPCKWEYQAPSPVPFRSLVENKAHTSGDTTPMIDPRKYTNRPLVCANCYDNYIDKGYYGCSGEKRICRKTGRIIFVRGDSQYGTPDRMNPDFKQSDCPAVPAIIKNEKE